MEVDMRHSTHVKANLQAMLQSDFDFDISKRLDVICDLDQFKKGEDESVWLQDKGIAPKMYEVYWDGEWIIDFADDVEPQIVIALFWQGFKKKYEAGKIHLNEFLTEFENSHDITKLIEKEQAKQKVAESMAGVGHTHGSGDVDMDVVNQVTEELENEPDTGGA